jgi:hypothetical protein
MTATILRAIVLNCFFLLIMPLASGADVAYHLGSIRDYSSRDLIQVNGIWRKDLSKRILVGLHVSKDTPGNSVFVKAYFYDKDNHLVAACPQPSNIWTGTPRGFESVGIPETISASKPNCVYFALPEDLQEKKWKSILVVFGDSTRAVAESLPQSAYPRLDFPEKNLVGKKP